MATFDGIIPELAKAGFIKKVNDLRYQISTLQQEIDTLSESTKTMFWSNSIPSDLGTVGELQSFSVQVKAYSLIDVPPTYSVIAGSLPSGLTLNPINGYITGVVGNYETITPCVFTVQAADNQTTITKRFTITVNAVNDAPTWITASELGDMTVDFISIQLSVNDPDSTPTFTIVDGSLPSGVTLSSSGLISGDNPRDNLTYTFTVEANDGTNQLQRQFTFVAFNEAPVWVTDGDLGTIIGSVFSKSLSATDNDSASLTYSVNSLSTLPVGVSLSNSGVLSGANPLTNTTHTFDIDVSDGVNVITRTFFFYAYNEAPVWVTNASLGSFNTPTISIQLSATDAENESLTYAVVAGNLPTGLTLTSSGLISGNNPFDSLTSSFTIAVSDKVNSVNREFSITCEVAGEAIYTSVGNYQFTVPTGVHEIDALVVAGGSGITSVGNMKATKGSTDTLMNPRYSFPGTVKLSASCKGSAGVVVGSENGNLYKIDMDTYGVLKGNNVLVSGILRKIIFYNNKYYAFSGTNIASSGDGLTWTLFNSNVPMTRVYDVLVDTGIIIAVGASGKIIYSLDGMNTWVSTQSGFGTSTIYSIIKGNGIYVAAGDAGKVSTSPDGITWTARSTGMTYTVGESAIFANGTFILNCLNNSNGAESNALISTDGISWSISATIPYMSAVVYSPLFGFFGVRGNFYYKSLDGVTWVKKYYALSGAVAPDVMSNTISFWDNNIVFASGFATSYGYVFHSTDGGSTLYNIHATSFGSLSPGSISGASYRKDGKLLALWSSSSAFCVSKNDLTMPLITYNGNAITNVTSVVSNADDSVVVVGTLNTGSGHEVSTDGGFSWTLLSQPPYNRTGWIGKTAQFYFFNGVWIALIVSDSSYAFYTSPDLISWTGYGTPSSGKITAKLVNNVFFVETNGGNFYTTDGLSWTPTPSGFSPVGFYDGKYYQYGTTSTIKYTTDISSSFTSVNVTALIGGTANLSNLYMTDNGQFILRNGSSASTVTGYYLTTDLVSSTRILSSLDATPFQTYDGRFVSRGTTMISTGLFKPVSPTPVIPRIYEKLNTLSSTVVATTDGLLKIIKDGYDAVDVCSPMIYSYGNITSSGDTVYQLTNYGVFSYNVSSGEYYFYPFNATYSTPRDVIVFNNFILATYNSGVYIRIDLTTKAVTVSSVGYNYMSYTIFNGELFAVAAPTNDTKGTPIIKTTDGITWTTVYTTTKAGNLFIKESTLCHYASESSTMTTSIDGTNWTTTATTVNTYTSITYNNGTWALVNTNYIMYSNDLVTWYTITLTQMLGAFTLIEKADIPDATSFIAYSSYGEKVILSLVPKGTSNTDATLTRPSTEGFSLTNPNNNGNYGKLSGIAGYKNNIPVNPSDTINVSVPSLDGAVRIIWGGSRDFPNNAV